LNNTLTQKAIDVDSLLQEKSLQINSLTDSLSAYALSSLWTQVSLQLNNSLVSTNYQDLMPFFKLLEDNQPKNAI
jgi:hypothetical protein